MLTKFQIAEKTRSLKKGYQSVLDHFPDVCNMVVRGDVSVVEIFENYEDGFNSYYTAIGARAFYKFYPSVNLRGK